jgi:hypothetical protein
LECGSPLPLSTGAEHSAVTQSARGLAQSKTWRIFGTLLTFLAIAISVHAQTYSIDWHKIAGGGGTSTGGVYAVSGTIGQPDTSGALTGGNYSLTGGFWSLISVVQTLGAPTLAITHAGSGVIVSWPSASAGWKLQVNTNGLNPADWSDVTDTIQDDGTTKTLTVNPPTGNRFYRLFKP